MWWPSSLFCSAVVLFVSVLAGCGGGDSGGDSGEDDDDSGVVSLPWRPHPAPRLRLIAWPTDQPDLELASNDLSETAFGYILESASSKVSGPIGVDDTLLFEIAFSRLKDPPLEEEYEQYEWIASSSVDSTATLLRSVERSGYYTRLEHRIVCAGWVWMLPPGSADWAPVMPASVEPGDYWQEIIDWGGGVTFDNRKTTVVVSLDAISPNGYEGCVQMEYTSEFKEDDGGRWTADTWIDFWIKPGIGEVHRISKARWGDHSNGTDIVRSLIGTAVND